MKLNGQDGARQLSLLAATISAILGFVITGSSCKSETRGGAQQSESTYQPAKDSLERLISNLAAMPGEFGESGGSGAWLLPAAEPSFDAIAAFGDSAVARLVDCMSDTSSAVPTLMGRHVSLGIVCYEVLSHVAYYEAYDDEPEGPNKYRAWEGDIPPSATHDQLLKAQIAWRSVIRQKRYRLL